MNGKEIASAVLAILKNAAGMLELLDLALSGKIVLSIDPARISLPRLKELTTNGIFLSEQGDQISTLTLEPCHELRRLHVSQSIYIDDYDSELFGRIGTLAPALTHLRLSAVEGGNYFFPPTLQAALQPLLEHIGNQSQTCALPASLTKVLVQGNPPPRFGRCGSSLIEYDYLLESLWGLQERDGRIVLLKHKEREEQTDLWQLPDGLSDWRDRLDGGEGCWDLDDRLLLEKKDLQIW